VSGFCRHFIKAFKFSLQNSLDAFVRYNFMLNYLAWLLVAGMYSPLFYRLYFKTDHFWSEDYSHAFFILPIALWLVWRKRKNLFQAAREQRDEPYKSASGLFILIVGILMSIVGWRQGNYFVYQISMVPVIFGMIIFLYGGRMSKTLAFPIFYLLFIAPPPAPILDAITMPMRRGVSVTTELILNLLNYPITREGLLLTIGFNDIYMAPACSGFRSLVTMFALVLVYVYITKGGLGKKLILVSFIAPLAMTGNLIRILTLCLITFYFGDEAGQGFFHNFSGIVIFVITISGLMGVELVIDKFLSKKQHQEIT
jgi:exosortase